MQCIMYMWVWRYLNPLCDEHVVLFNIEMIMDVIRALTLRHML